MRAGVYDNEYLGQEIDEEMENEMMAREEDFDIVDFNYNWPERISKDLDIFY